MPVDYDALAAQHGGTPVIDYDALAAQHGGTPVATSPKGFFESASDASGLSALAHPIDTITGLPSAVKGMASNTVSNVKQGIADYKKTGLSETTRRDFGRAVPIVGPALAEAQAQHDAGNDAGMAGTMVGTVAGLAGPKALKEVAPMLPGAVGKVVENIPTKAKASEIFQDLNANLKDQPVPLNTAAAPLQRAIEIAARGGTMPTPVKALLERSQAIEPMTFPEIRDYQMSLSDLSASDKMAMNMRMKGAVAQLNKALYQDIRNAAENGGGFGADYDKAMTDYRRAAMMSNAGKGLLKYGGKAALGAAGAGGVYEVGKIVSGN